MAAIPVFVEQEEDEELDQAANLESIHHSTQSLTSETLQYGKVVYGREEAVNELLDWIGQLKSNSLATNCLHTELHSLPTTGVLLSRYLSLSPSWEYNAISNYEIHQELGTGTYGSVYLCGDKVNEKFKFAMKMIPLQKFDRNEVDILVKLSKDQGGFCLPSVFGILLEQSCVVIFMEYVDFIWDRLTFSDNPNEALILQFLLGSFKGLKFLKLYNIIHADIKPQNMGFLISTNEVKFLDFGSVKRPHEKITTKGMTPEYMPPEVCTYDYNRCDCMVDVWALGCTFFFLLTGKHPWNWLECDASPQRANLIMNTIKDDPQKMNIRMGYTAEIHGFSPALKYILCKMLEPEKENRLTPEQGIELVEQILRQQTTMPVPVTSAELVHQTPALSQLHSSYSSSSSRSSQGFSMNHHVRMEEPPQSPDVMYQSGNNVPVYIPQTRMNEQESLQMRQGVNMMHIYPGHGDGIGPLGHTAVYHATRHTPYGFARHHGGKVSRPPHTRVARKPHQPTISEGPELGGMADSHVPNQSQVYPVYHASPANEQPGFPPMHHTGSTVVHHTGSTVVHHTGSTVVHPGDGNIPNIPELSSERQYLTRSSSVNSGSSEETSMAELPGWHPYAPAPEYDPVSQDTGYHSTITAIPKEVVIELRYRQQCLAWKCALHTRVQDVVQEVFQKARMLVYSGTQSLNTGAVVVTEKVTEGSGIRKWSEQPTKEEASRLLQSKTVLVVNGFE